LVWNRLVEVPALLSLRIEPTRFLPVAAIRLVPFEERHLPDFRALVDDDLVRRFTRVPDPVPDGFDRTWAERYERGRADGTRMNFAIEDPGDGRFLGIAVAPHVDREERTAELGYVVAPAARGTGVASAALRELTRWAFEEQDMYRLYLLISVANEGSKRVAERCGYQREGVLRGMFFKQGVHEDTESWSRLATDG
jgi:RimJ/RimL family protein N-acetyltransferase